MVAAVADALTSRCRVPPAAGLVIGLSGGADSVALLLAAAVLRDRSRGELAGLNPVAVHVHHHLRDSADEDAAFVQALGDRLGIDTEVGHVNVKARRGNLSANARRARYDVLRRAALRHGVAFVAVAHHADDQLETMLMALCRGSAPRALAGMRWSRALGDGVRLIRPLLGLGRGDCESMCRAARIEWRDDPTNRDDRRTRARLRRDVVPVLESLWPGAAARASGAGDVLAEAARLLDRRIAHTFGEASQRTWDRAALAAQPSAVIAGGLRRAALHARPEITDALGGEQLRRAAATIADGLRRPRSFTWAGGLSLRVSSTLITLTASEAAS